MGNPHRGLLAGGRALARFLKTRATTIDVRTVARSMSFDESLLAPEAASYLHDLQRPPYARVMERIEREVKEERQPAVGRGTGAILRSLVALAGGGRVLEVGTNVGYSGLWLAAGLRADGHLDTIELDATIARRAREHFAEAGVGSRVTVHEGAALDVLPRLDGPYDLVFIDAVKAEYPRYLDHALRVLRVGGVLTADNLFWQGGRVWDKEDKDAETEGVRVYTRRIFEDERFASSVVPSEDGLGVAVRTSA